MLSHYHLKEFIYASFYFLSFQFIVFKLLILQFNDRFVLRCPERHYCIF